jgi:hypothetical protein
VAWFAASAIMYVRFKDGQQDRFPIWENTLLIEAESHSSARAKAQDRATHDEGDSGGTFRWAERPAEWVFAGIRKVTQVSHEGATLGDGDEVTYSEFEVESEAALRALATGEEVSVRYIE